MPDEDPERVAQWGLGRHNGWFAWRTGENIPPNNSMGMFGTLPGPSQHPLAVPAAWLAGVDILFVLPCSYGFGGTSAGLLATAVAVVLGILVLVFSVIALTGGPRHVLPVVTGILGLVLVVLAPVVMLSIRA